MTQNNRFALTTELLAHLAETPVFDQPTAPTDPSLSNVLTEFSPLPQAALFLGVANDGLPVLLNLLDPVPGPLLIVGDSESGKTRLLQVIARGVEKAQTSPNIKFVVLT